jgi:hypothetical protein
MSLFLFKSRVSEKNSPPSAPFGTICWAIYAWNPRYHGTVERGHDVRMGLESGASWFQTNLITNLGLMVMSIQHCTTILNGGYKLPKLGGTGAPSRISDLVNSSVWRLLAWSLFNYDNYKVVPPSIRKFWLLVYVHSSFHPINWIQLAWSCFIYTVLVVYVSHKPNSLSVGHQWHHLAMQQSQAKNGSCFLVVSRKQWNGLHFTIVYLKHEEYPKLRLLDVRVFVLIRTVLQLLRLTFQTNP